MASKKDQRLMVDNMVLGKIIEYASPSMSDIILEVGAGNGHLTMELAEKAGKVFAVERDRELCATLRERVKGCKNVQVIEGDALKVKLPECNKIVSNLPYSISKKITIRFLEHGFKEAFLLYQQEFAEKLTANPGVNNYRFITALTQSTCEIQLLMKIPPTAFQPQPKVSSMLVKLTQKTIPEKGYVNFLQELFNHKNKNLKNILGEKTPTSLSDKKPVDMRPEELRLLYSEFTS
ncbi:MAG: 16S rRNA (adenine(1518)-N(6)/adenine(1519)-N(6))-dimethyltransferase RsmA [Pseudomonadota bacterium]